MRSKQSTARLFVSCPHLLHALPVSLVPPPSPPWRTRRRFRTVHRLPTGLRSRREQDHPGIQGYYLGRPASPRLHLALTSAASQPVTSFSFPLCCSFSFPHHDSAFSFPVLSVAADVVQELEGEDALYGLWTLFTKCKESLKDGRRLENISWRLWYREIAAQHSPASSPGSLSPPLSEKRSQSPITPVSDDGPNQDEVSPLRPLLDDAADMKTAHSWHGDVLNLSAVAVGRRLSTASAPTHRPHSHAVVSVGKVIIDILPGKLDINAGDKPLERKRNPISQPSLVVPIIVQPRPVVTVQLPSTPPPATAAFPRVIVVNPTPHPTPPATPSISRVQPVLPSTTQIPLHLLPPPPTRPVFASPAAVNPVKPDVKSQPVSSASRDTSPRVSERGDETLKASDRRFFLQAGESSERDSPDCASQQPDAKSDDHAQSPSSVTSSQLRSDDGGRASGAAVKRGMGRAHARKSKETIRHVPARAALQRTQTQMQVQRQTGRKTFNGEPRKTTFNIGSVSSNGSRSGGAGVSKTAPKAPAVTKHLPPEPPKQGAGIVQPPPRRGIVVSTSSECETTDTDDDSEWASEDNSADEREKEQREREVARLRKAAEERDMFAKAPKRSYSNLNRTQSGLLSQLLNPDPNIFPPNHPYRTRGFSSQDMTQFGRQGGAPRLPTSKSTAAVPLAAQITAQAPMTNGSVDVKSEMRPKGRPASTEMEDTDTEDENPDNAIQVSHSLAQQKLAALADTNRRRNSDYGPSSVEPPVRPVLHTIATAPIPMGHPYNLPAPAPPMTPRTTRRQMLSTELSESLRRNLLWERQVSRNNLTGGRRGGLLGNALRPLTAVHADPSTSLASGSKSGQEDEAKDGRRPRSVSRNRSWADDYHYAGW